MKIPKPDEFAAQHGHNPFPPRWEKWLSAVREGILSAQPVAGRHVSVDEHPGNGTVINVAARRPITQPPSGECDAPVLCCIINNVDPEFPYNERWGEDPAFTEAWESAWCPSVTLTNSGEGYYYWFVAGHEDGVETIHGSNAEANNCMDMVTDFVINCRVRLYPTTGGAYRLAVAGDSSGFFHHLYFWANLSPEQFSAASSGTISVPSEILACDDDPAGGPVDSYDLAVFTPQIISGQLPVASYGGAMNIHVA